MPQPVMSFSASMRATPARQASVSRTALSAISTASEDRTAFIAKTDNVANRMYAAFGKRTFSAAELGKAIAGLTSLETTAAKHRVAALAHLSTSIRIASDNTEIVAEVEELAALEAKIATLRTVAEATLAEDEMAEDDVVQIDDSGFVVDDEEDVLDELPDTAEPTASTASEISENESDAQPVGVPEESTSQTQSADPQEANLPPAPVTSSQRQALPTPGEPGPGISENESDAQPVGVPDAAPDSSSNDSGYAEEEMTQTAPDSSLDTVAADRTADAPVSETGEDAKSPQGDAAPVETTVTKSASTTAEDDLEDVIDDTPAESLEDIVEEAPAEEGFEDDLIDGPDMDGDDFDLEDDDTFADVFADEILNPAEDELIDDEPVLSASAARRSTATRTSNKDSGGSDLLSSIIASELTL